MENFILAGKAKTVFKLIEMKARQEKIEQLKKEYEKKNKSKK